MKRPTYDQQNDTWELQEKETKFELCMDKVHGVVHDSVPHEWIFLTFLKTHILSGQMTKSSY